VSTTPPVSANKEQALSRERQEEEEARKERQQPWERLRQLNPGLPTLGGPGEPPKVIENPQVPKELPALLGGRARVFQNPHFPSHARQARIRACSTSRGRESHSWGFLRAEAFRHGGIATTHSRHPGRSEVCH
jgi:hypothetical protein